MHQPWRDPKVSLCRLNGNMGVEPKIGGKPPKWMVKIMENPIKMDNLGVPLFLETPIWNAEEELLLKPNLLMS